MTPLERFVDLVYFVVLAVLVVSGLGTAGGIIWMVWTDAHVAEQVTATCAIVFVFTFAAVYVAVGDA